MHDLLFFLKACVASKTLITSLCGLLIIPLAAWILVRLLAPFIRRMDADAAWQAPLAAIAAAMPGSVFLLLAIIDLGGAYSSGCLQFLWGRMLFAGILSMTVLAFARATTITYQRVVHIRTLVALSHEPAQSVLSIAQRVGVQVRVLPFPDPFCALARIIHPVVLVSRGTLERLNAEELEAALRHELAHLLRADLPLSAAFSFFAELLPLSTGDLISTYAIAREFAADQHATRKIEAHHLASAIISLAGTQKIANSVAALAEDSATIKPRVVALLEERARTASPLGRR
ncbi:MAG: M56 family metallopeptidase, partial [Candidatus Eremiobacteraeota bacterium]|nr:M56 family metallopeptidase [Candidatus Eremiobacteraeota bacterium]